MCTSTECAKTIQFSRSQPGMILSPRGHMAMPRDIFICHIWGRRTPGIQWVGVRNAMLLNILQYTCQPPEQRMIQHKMPIVLRLRNCSSLIVHVATFSSEGYVCRLNGFSFCILYKGKIILESISIVFILLSRDCHLTDTICSILFQANTLKVKNNKQKMRGEKKSTGFIPSKRISAKWLARRGLNKHQLLLFPPFLVHKNPYIQNNVLCVHC